MPFSKIRRQIWTLFGLQNQNARTPNPEPKSPNLEPPKIQDFKAFLSKNICLTGSGPNLDPGLFDTPKCPNSDTKPTIKKGAAPEQGVQEER